MNNLSKKKTDHMSYHTSIRNIVTSIGLLFVLLLNSCVSGNPNSKESNSEKDAFLNPPEDILNKYRTQTSFSDPGDLAYLLVELPTSEEEICTLIKKQLIHPMEAADMPEIFPKDKRPEDGLYPTVSDMLQELIKRNRKGLTMDRLPQNRLLVACYHHGLLLASILRHQGKSVRLRAGFARYYEEQLKIRFSHVVCEVWNVEKKRWDILDPDRNIHNVSREKFEFPSEVWSNYIEGNLPKTNYIGSIGQGENVYVHSLLLDMAFVICNERSYWHTPNFIFKKDFDINDLDEEKILVLNRIAELMDDPENNFILLEKLYNENSFIQSHERAIDEYYERN